MPVNARRALSLTTIFSRLEHDPRGAHLGVAENLLHALEVDEEIFDIAEDLVTRQRDVDERLHHRTRHLVHHPVDREDAVEVPLGDVGKREQLQRLTGGCAVHDEHVELALALVLLDPHEAGDLLHPRRRRHLLGDEVVDALATRTAMLR